ncbi:MAG: class B sortase [Clostridia bacterium]|nr:class B sortase [Clostridia bacterium]
MARYEKSQCLKNIKKFFVESIPNASDNISRIIIKCMFFLCIIGILGSCIYLTGYFGKYYAEKKIINEQREWFAFERGNLLLKQQNNEYVAWIGVDGTELNNPIYQTDDNGFYLNHNALKEKSGYGALFLDCRSDFSDRNIVIYGNTNEDGSLFSTLHNYRRINFLRENSIISIKRAQKNYDYRVFAVLIINSNTKQDKSFNVCQKDFSSNKAFSQWITEVEMRSFVKAKIDLTIEDEYLTLITSCDDFEGARLVVMARRLRQEEERTDLYKYSLNQNPKFPKKWYEDRNIEYIY